MFKRLILLTFSLFVLNFYSSNSIANECEGSPWSKTILKNIRLGYRYKFYVEFMNQLNDQKGKLWNVGFDFRSYHKIYRNIKSNKKT